MPYSREARRHVRTAGIETGSKMIVLKAASEFADYLEHSAIGAGQDGLTNTRDKLMDQCEAIRNAIREESK